MSREDLSRQLEREVRNHGEIEGGRRGVEAGERVRCRRREGVGGGPSGEESEHPRQSRSVWSGSAHGQA